MKSMNQNHQIQPRASAQGLVPLNLRRLVVTALFVFLSCMVSVGAHADWADQLGEGSGVDRAVMMTAPGASSSSPAAILQSPGTNAMRDSIAGNITREMAGSFGGSFTPAAFTSTMPSVPSIGAGGDDNGEDGSGNGNLF
jgi:hypothetical protein